MMTMQGGGKKLYFPNQIVKLVRSAKPLLSNQATFRIPLSMNKLDLKHYLARIYKIPVLKVNTIIPPPRIARNPFTGVKEKRPEFKKAIVTMASSFQYPARPDVEGSFGGKERLESQKKRWRRGGLKGFVKDEESKDDEVKPEPLSSK